jgi:hypothetical protein
LALILTLVLSPTLTVALFLTQTWTLVLNLILTLSQTLILGNFLNQTDTHAHPGPSLVSNIDCGPIPDSNMDHGFHPGRIPDSDMDPGCNLSNDTNSYPCLNANLSLDSLPVSPYLPLNIFSLIIKICLSMDICFTILIESLLFSESLPSHFCQEYI